MKVGQKLDAPYIDWNMTAVIDYDIYKGLGRPKQSDYTVDIQRIKKERKRVVKGVRKTKSTFMADLVLVSLFILPIAITIVKKLWQV